MRSASEGVGVLSLAALLVAGSCAEEEAWQGEPTSFAQVDPQAPARDEAGGIDLSGTWGVRVRTRAKITAPIIGASEAPVELGIKLVVGHAEGKVTADVQICSLTSDSANLKVDYSKLLPFMKLSVSAPIFEARAGTKVPLPALEFRVGLSETNTSVDVDGDGRPGGALPIVALGLIPIQTYSGLRLSVNMDATVRSGELIDGTVKFAGAGKIFGSNSSLLTGGDLSVEQTQIPTSFTAKKLAGEVSCAMLQTRI